MRQFYYLCAAILALALLADPQPDALAHGPRHGGHPRQRDLGAIDGRQSACSTRSIAFALCAGIIGLAGALLGHKIAYLAPDVFNILLSIQLLLMVVVGGLGSIHGAVFGAIFVALLPPIIALMRDSIPATISDVAGAPASA